MYKVITLITTVLTLGACTTLEELAVGRTDRLAAQQFYVTYSKDGLPRRESNIVILPVTIQTNMDTPDLSYQRTNINIAHIASAIEDRLTHFDVGRVLSDDSLLQQAGAPAVYIGSSAGDNVPEFANIEQEAYEKYPPMIAYLAKPDAAWRSNAATLAAEQDADFILRVWVSFAQYPKAKSGMFGKQVHVGTHYSEKIRFLSAELEPVEVLQVSGYIIDRNGNVLRAGAEGVVHSDSPFWVQMLGVQRTMDDTILTSVLESTRREDLPGNPLSLDIALRHLVAQLTNRDPGGFGVQAR